jgi:hypothetical protein
VLLLARLGRDAHAVTPGDFEQPATSSEAPGGGRTAAAHADLDGDQDLSAATRGRTT